MNDEREGLERLREAIEEVALDIEAQREPARRRPPFLRYALAATLILAALSAWLILTRPASPPEVEVLVLRVRGQTVRARLVDGGAPSTIVVLPQRRTAATTAVAAPGGMP